MLKVFRSEKEIRSISDIPGTIKSDNKSFLRFACSNGYILAKEIQLEGKKRMPVEEFLKGHRFNQ
jgi:methionyl-tRNA formyltransferase